jgi:hypothetical protein
MRHIDDLPDEMLSRIFTVGSEIDLRSQEDAWIADPFISQLEQQLPSYPAQSFLQDTYENSVAPVAKPFADLTQKVCQRWAYVAGAKSNRHLFMSRLWLSVRWYQDSSDYRVRKTDLVRTFTDFITALRASGGADLWVTFQDSFIETSDEESLLQHAVALLRPHRLSLVAVDLDSSGGRLCKLASHFFNRPDLFPRLEWVGFSEQEPRAETPLVHDLPAGLEALSLLSHLYDIDVTQDKPHHSPQSILAGSLPPCRPAERSLGFLAGPRVQILCLRAHEQNISKESLFDSLSSCKELRMLFIDIYVVLGEPLTSHETSKSAALPLLTQLHVLGGAVSIISLLLCFSMPALRVLSLNVTDDINPNLQVDMLARPSIHLPLLERITRRGLQFKDAAVFRSIVAPKLQRVDLIHSFDRWLIDFDPAKTWIQPLNLSSPKHILISIYSAATALRRMEGIDRMSLTSLDIIGMEGTFYGRDPELIHEFVLPNLEVIEFSGSSSDIETGLLLETVHAPSLRLIKYYADVKKDTTPHVVIHTPLGEGKTLFDRARDIEIFHHDDDDDDDFLFESLPGVLRCVFHRPTVHRLASFAHLPKLQELILDVVNMRSSGEMRAEIAESIKMITDTRQSRGYSPLSVLIRDSLSDQKLC